MVKWYRGEVRYKPLRDENGAMVTEEDSEGNVHTVMTNIVEWEDMGMIRKLANEAQKNREASNLGARFLNRTFANFDRRRDENAYQQCSAYANREDLYTSDRNGLLILGGVGTGKTHLAAAIANCLVDRGIPAEFGTYIDYLEAIRMEYDHTGEREELTKLRTTTMLVIDDLGKEKRTEWSQQTLFSIINYRYEHRLPIVITSNLTPNEIRAHVGEAIQSRLFEMCSAVIMNGSDYRMEKGNAGQ